IHPKYKTPSFSTVLTGVVVAIPALFMNLKEVVDLSSIGTLFAFVLVCGGVLVLENSKNPPARPKFKTPYINGRYIVPLLYFGVLFLAYRAFKKESPFADNAPLVLFLLVAAAIAVLSFLKRLSVIPVLGLLTCLYLMSQLGITNWIRFLIWLAAGLTVYFLYH